MNKQMKSSEGISESLSALSQAEFEALSPYERGYTVYMAGKRDDQPHVPDENNPYPNHTRESLAWIRGMTRAVLECQDSEA